MDSEWTGQLAVGVCARVGVCVCWGGLEGYPAYTSQLQREGREGESYGDESVAYRGADDGGLHGMEGSKVKSQHQRQGHSFLTYCTAHTDTYETH